MLHNQMEFVDMHNGHEYAKVIWIHVTGLLYKRWVDYFARMESIDSGDFWCGYVHLVDLRLVDQKRKTFLNTIKSDLHFIDFCYVQ